jgi:hypothetical protein
VLCAEQSRKLLDAALGHYLEVPVALALLTGLSPSTIVTVTLRPFRDGTKLRLVHSGWGTGKTACDTRDRHARGRTSAVPRRANGSGVHSGDEENRDGVSGNRSRWRPSEPP